MASHPNQTGTGADGQGEKDPPSPIPASAFQNPLSEISSSPSPSPSSSTAPALVLSNSGKRIDQTGRKKYVKQVTGRHNDTELHLAAQRGDVGAVRQILLDVESQVMGTLGDGDDDDLDIEIAEVRACLVNEENELGETPLFTTAEKGHLHVVKELLNHSTAQTVSKKNRSGFDPLHIAASKGHHCDWEIVRGEEGVDGGNYRLLELAVFVEIESGASADANG
ncbi:Ankyrin repeat-containing protein [Vigna angularis]|uniref:Ankyrin repeat-containing protein n=1 Tax=Phaseolus angularis TaxID=3914 RepID=A0A8T0K3Z0_PHAAN|nr:Ankyrin repeat-containing protein [Vigna angularis]